MTACCSPTFAPQLVSPVPDTVSSGSTLSRCSLATLDGSDWRAAGCGRSLLLLWGWLREITGLPWEYDGLRRGTSLPCALLPFLYLLF